MRWNLMKCFDKIYIIDLHGNSKKKEICPDGSKDENVFDIQQGVSINIFVKTGQKTENELAEVYHFDVFGKREEKYDYLLASKFSKVPFTKLKPSVPEYFFVPIDHGMKEEYDNGFSVQGLFPISSNGLFTARDNFTIHFTEQQAIDVIKEFLSLDDESARSRFELGTDVRDWSVKGARNDLMTNLDFNKIRKINYRPFDTRYTYYTGNSKGFHCMPRGKFMKHFIESENIGLVVGRQGQAVGSMTWNLVSTTSNITDLNVYYRGGGMIFPLYIYPEADKMFADEKRKPNLNQEIIEDIAKITKLKFETEKNADNKTFAPIDVLDYIYAVLHSPTYREKYKEFLKTDFPRIPYPESAKQFRKLSKLGEKLRRLHLLEDVEPKQGVADYPIPGDNKIEKITYSGDKVYINQTQYFAKVPAEAWSFYIGGYQPAQKWLKDRKWRELSYEDIQHYRRVVLVLRETWRVMREIDKIQEGT